MNPAHPELNPPASPNYAPPPWSYTGARILNVVCRASNPDALGGWVPSPLSLSRDDGLFVLFFLRVPRIPELGEHYHSTECGILIPARTANSPVHGSTFALMFVDNDLALAGGREIWGYPKKLGTIHFDETDAGRLKAAVHHMPFRDGEGRMIFSAEVDFDGSGDRLWDIVAGLEPRLLRRAIPDPYSATAQSIEVLRVVHTAGKIYEQRSGRANVRIEASEEQLHRFGEIEVLGATFRVCDFVLPYAQRL